MANLRSEKWKNALELFGSMQRVSAKATVGTIVKMLQACGKLRAFDEGKQIHGYALRFGLVSNTLVCNSIISMYSRNSRFELARAVFDSMEDCSRNLSSWNAIISSYAVDGCLNDSLDNTIKEMECSGIKPDVITWNSVLSGYVHQGLFEKVLTSFRSLHTAGFKPDSCSVTSALQAVTELGLFKIGKEIHGYMMRTNLNYDVYVCTSLVDMYVKNDCLDKAHEVFRHAKNKNVYAWNSLISGYSFKGLVGDAEKLLNQMEEERIKPDLVTWNGLISGYSIQGRTEEALTVINRIKSSGITPNVVSWTSLISGCSQNKKYFDALRIFSQMQEENVKPNATTICNLLCACAGPSLLKKGEEIHCFSMKLGFVDDIYVATSLIDMYYGKPHPEEGEIYFELYRLISEIRKLGYVADLNCVFQNIDDNEKEKILMSHTEKLAMVYGMMKMKGGSPIRVVKNTRICCDCHTVAKYISLARNCEILLQDGGRFHHFKNGKCACNDRW
ncbi:hypothetical protein TSUD_350320 [Trifolium subterraneum]|uniref:DYW domain-containing protein n=1 Tax=Trifolium subterraneum TaxID=3900 RepID=A0A2Z6NEZ8_TRISU|nr:hypothetical protein TSUD_350320 [Trifolium subterraneum]